MQDDDERKSQAAQFSCLAFPTYVPHRVHDKATLIMMLDGDVPYVPVFTDKQRCIAFGAERKFTVGKAQDDAPQLADLLENLMHSGAAFAVLDPPPSGRLSACPIDYAIQRLRRTAPPPSGDH